MRRKDRLRRLSTDDAARHLACSRDRLYDLVQLGKLKPRRDGRRLLFKLTDLDTYLETLHDPGTAGSRQTCRPTTLRLTPGDIAKRRADSPTCREQGRVTVCELQARIGWR